MKLYQHQKEIVNDDPKYTGLFLGTGSGKTRTALSLSVNTASTLVISPKMQRDDKVFEREAVKMNYDMDLTCISKEDLKKYVKNNTLPQFGTIIIDECHTLLGVYPDEVFVKGVRTPKASAMFNQLRIYLRDNPPDRLYLLTATLVKNPMSVWAAGVLLGKWSYNSHRRFVDKFYTTFRHNNRNIYTPRSNPQIKEDLAKLVKKLGYVGRLEDYYDIPEQTYITESIALTTEQKKAIKDIKLEYPDPLVQTGKIHQIEQGVLKGDEYSKGQRIKDNKVDRILELSQEFPKMIVFARYTDQINKIAEAIGDKAYTLTGQTKNRGELMSSLKKKDKYVFIVQASMSAGWELPDCPCIIFVSKDYSFVNHDQALGRVQRANHIKKNVYITLVTEGKSIDKAVLKAVENKIDFSEHVYCENNK